MYPRIPARRKVGIIQPDREIVYCWTMNASKGGVQVVADFDAAIGAQFDIIVNLPELSGETYIWVHARVQVVHVIFSGSVQAYKIGLKFIDFKENGRELFNEFLLDHMRRYSFR